MSADTSHETAPESRPTRFMRIADVLKATGIGSKSELYRRIQAKQFPKGNRISHRMVVWPEAVIADWQQRQLEASAPA